MIVYVGAIGPAITGMVVEVRDHPSRYRSSGDAKICSQGEERAPELGGHTKHATHVRTLYQSPGN